MPKNIFYIFLAFIIMCSIFSRLPFYYIRIQSHLSESMDEVKWVSELFPNSKHYSGVYDDTGLLGNKTIMAHGVHLSKDELQMLRYKEAGISHCPNSNCSLKSGFCNVLRLKDHGVKIGLGTDCAGGYSPSMIDSMRYPICLCIKISSHKHLCKLCCT